jgi:hypothetical protein
MMTSYGHVDFYFLFFSVNCNNLFFGNVFLLTICDFNFGWILCSRMGMWVLCCHAMMRN